MTEQTAVARPVGRWCPPGLALLALGAACTLVSFTSLSWYRISGPAVVTRADRLPATTSGTVFVLDPGEGSQHSPVIWVVALGCVLAAVAAQLPAVRARALWTAVCATSAAIALLDAVGRALLVHAAADGVALTPGASVHAETGTWVAAVGLVLLGVSALVTPATPEPLPG